MNYLKENVFGVEVPIKRIQEKLYNALTAKWGSVIDGYGMANINNTERGQDVEVYLGDLEYKSVLQSEESKFFFLQGNTPENNHGVFKNEVNIVFILDIGGIKGNDNRQTEEIHFDVSNEISKIVSLKDFKGFKYGVDEFSRLAFSLNSMQNFKFTDWQPYHIFTATIKVEYALSEYKC